MDIGRYIKKYRKKRGLTQQELAELSKVNASYISHIETGKKLPSLQTLKKISKILKVPIQAFFGDVKKGKIPEYDPKIDKIADLLKNTDDTIKKNVKMFINFLKTVEEEQ